jgi:hypothetical protein
VGGDHLPWRPLEAACHERTAVSPFGGVKAEHRIAECPCGGRKPYGFSSVFESYS